MIDRVSFDKWKKKKVGVQLFDRFIYEIASFYGRHVFITIIVWNSFMKIQDKSTVTTSLLDCN